MVRRGARTPAAFAWLALRPLRQLTGHTETLGGEFALVRGILWRWLLPPAARARAALRRELPGPARFEQPRLRRWSAARARGGTATGTLRRAAR